MAVEHPIVGDVKKALHMLLHMPMYTQADEWLQKVRKWKEEYPLSYKQKESNLKPQHVIDLISELTNGEAIVTTEVG
ncbi:acetolactate synthase catalytic subunit, partial [Bacillus toyonensis]